MSGSIDEQVTQARTSVLVVPAPERCVLEVTGSDRLSWLNGLLTCQLAGRAAGDAVLGLAVAQKGKIVSDVVVVVAEERALVIVQRATADALVASFEHHLMMEDAELRRVDDQVWFFHGPGASARLAQAREAGATGGLLDVTGSGGAVVVSRAPLAAASDGEGDLAGWDTVRVLAGVPRFGVDFDDTTYPQEAALEKAAVSFEKGCYLGQDVVCMLEMRGHVKRRLVSLAVAGDAAPEPRATVTDTNGAAIGEVTSAVCFAGEVRALAMIKYAFITKGTEVTVLGRSATVL
jgi:folate-binding protein YgfZ